MADFVPPSFLTEDQDSIFRRMQEVLPGDIESAKGGFAWDYLYPVAVEKARMGQFTISNALQMTWPQFASDKWLDLHAENRGIYRKAATAAIGIVTVTGKEGTVIPVGTLFSTASTDEDSSLDFSATEQVTIPSSGAVDVPVQCTSLGIQGNVSAGTIVLKGTNISGITAVINNDACSGGTEVEDDESLRARVLDYDRHQGQSFVGSMADYRRWALSVPGTGAATIVPAQDDTGLVQIVLTDANGSPATEELCTQVYNFIMRPDDPYQRLAPINANLKVIPPEKIPITIDATVELDNSNIPDVKDRFQAALLPYFGGVPNEGEIRYTRVASILSETSGVHDYKDLKVNGDTVNIPIGVMDTPVIQAINLNSGSV